MKIFNKDFMLGAATAAHQVEGNNVNSDFWTLENLPGSMYKEPSLDAVDHYHRYEEDIKLLAAAGLNSYRFSIEWARIEPIKGEFDRIEIKHYRKVLECCYENGVIPIVTLHHFSSPKWLITEGGWESETTVEYFGEYCKYLISELGDRISYICTINEANMGVQISRIMKEYQVKMAKTSEAQSANADIQVGINIDIQSAMEKYYRAAGEAFKVDPRKLSTFHDPRSSKGDLIIMKCHERARKIIKEINPSIKVGLTMSLYDYQAQLGGEEYVKSLWDEDFLHYLPFIQEDDFFGVQNYTRKVFGPKGKIEPDENTRLTEVGNEFYPESLAGVLRYVSRYWKKPIIVTENGIATSNDKDRVEFIQEALASLYQCMEEGIEVLGYMHWSLLDNFEWQLGYTPKFGLISVDRKTQTRYAKESLSVLGNIKKFGL